jgi:hypothetical protein
MIALVERAPSSSYGWLPVVMLLLVMIATPGQARAQQAAPVDPTSPLARELLTCAEIEDDRRRLDCFDRLAAPLAQRAEQGVTVLRGEGDWDSNELTLTGAWRLTWNSQGSILTIELRDSLDQLVDIVGNQIGPGEGTSKLLKQGTWRLAVRAIGRWEVRVVEDMGD